MISWGTVTVGGIAFREEWSVEETDDGQIAIAGSPLPSADAATARAMHHNVLGLSGLTVPVTFSDKALLSGFYRVDRSSSRLMQQPDVDEATATWELSLVRIGSSRDVEFESRVPTIARATEVAGTPSFWHAPAVGVTSYYTGATVPTGSTSRESSEGAVVVYRGLPNNVLPRWTAAVGDYLKGSARLLFDGFRHVGTATPPHTAWELSNGLVRVAGDVDGAITVGAWDVNNWRSTKGYRFTVGGVALTDTPDLTVLRCDPEECTVRLSWPSAPGRVVVDLSLRRGARFVTGVMKRHAAATLGVVRSAAETAAVVTGGLRATAADADGNRFAMGSTRTVTTATGTAAISKAGITSFDFFLGHEVGDAPATGDAFADLFAQYLGAASDRTRVVRR